MRLLFFSLLFVLSSCGQTEMYDVLITNAKIYDGSGSPAFDGVLAIRGDTIAAMGAEVSGKGVVEINAMGQAVAPGFINMLSWATESLIHDGRGLSDLVQGVTLEVMGEGTSMGPLNDQMKQDIKSSQGDIKYDISWTTLGEYLQYLEDKGVSPNVASFVGATTVRIHEIGYEDRPPSVDELERMKQLVREAMEEGAVGLGSSLIYAPAFYADTEELIELSKVIAEYDGLYVTHMRSEGNNVIEALGEVMRIASAANCRAEIYHLKAAGEANWPKMEEMITKIELARQAGVRVAANMYNYTAGATGLNAAMPPWVQEGGYQEWARRLQDPAIRKKVASEMRTDATEWENLYFLAGSPENVFLVGFKNDTLRHYTGKSLAEVASIRGTSPEMTAIDLVIQDGSRVGTVYFLMSEENIKRQLKLPYMTFGSDASALAPEGVFLQSNPHPRAYGNFARLLGKYVRDEQVIPLEDAIRKLTYQAAVKLRINRRGLLKPGFYADVVIFDPNTIQDHATFENPHQLATGVQHVFVNGKQVLKDGEHTGATPGRFVKGAHYESPSQEMEIKSDQE